MTQPSRMSSRRSGPHFLSLNVGRLAINPRARLLPGSSHSHTSYTVARDPERETTALAHVFRVTVILVREGAFAPQALQIKPRYQGPKGRLGLAVPGLVRLAFGSRSRADTDFPTPARWCRRYQQRYQQRC
ncbi:hypothetical protein L209DRAFT_508918 [Thermothelomyces heterothallicus CBS 203.75]